MFFLNIFKPKPKHFKGLKPINRDDNGLDWYELTDSLNMSVERYAKLQKFIIIWNRNLSKEELHKLVDMASECLEDGIAKVSGGKRMNAIKLGAILLEIKQRSEQIRSFEIMCDLLAIQMVRSDEDPYTFDNNIHLEKKEYLMSLSKKKEEPFFFQSTVYKGLTNSSITSRENFQEYQKLSEVQQKEFQEAVRYLDSLK